MADRNDRVTEESREELRTAKETKAEQEQKLQKKKKRRRKALVSLLTRLVMLAAVIYILFFVIIGVTSMPSSDMFPRIDAGDLVLYYRLDKDVRAQDVIVFEKDMSQVVKTETARAAYSAAPSNVRSTGKEQFISRVVAIAGDTVEVTEEGNLIINGSTMIEAGIFYSTHPYLGYTKYPLTLGEGECFVLADSRQGGADSRFFGPVHVSEIKGTVITILRRNKL